MSLDLRRYLIENKNGMANKKRPVEISIHCPNCGKGEGHFSFNLLKRKGGCLKCGYAVHDSVSLISRLENVPETKAKIFLMTGSYDSNRSDIIIRLLDQRELPYEESEPEYHMNSNVPSFFIQMVKEDRNPPVLMPTVFKSRNYSLATIKKLEIGYCTEGDYAARIIFPIKCFGMTSFYARRIFDWMDKKYKNPPGSKHSYLLYNYDNIPRNADLVFVVEGATDVCRLTDYGYYSVSASGKKISSEQIDLLVNLYPREVVFLFDSDAVKENIHSFEKASNRLNCSFVTLPKKGEGEKAHYYDPDDCPRDLFDRAVKDRVGMIRAERAIKILKKFGGDNGSR